jgi:predicted acetyltransferase
MIRSEKPQTTRDQSASATLRLRPPRTGDETAFRAAHQVMAAEDFTFGLGLGPAMAWSTYLNALSDHRTGRNLPAGMVPQTFLVADVAGEIVGRTSIRHELNETLERVGGHIGYCVLPRHRRRGYATQILRQSLIVARAAGVEQVLLICDDSNIGSRTVIEGCGGRLDSVAGTEPPIRRYWID